MLETRQRMQVDCLRKRGKMSNAANTRQKTPLPRHSISRVSDQQWEIRLTPLRSYEVMI